MILRIAGLLALLSISPSIALAQGELDQIDQDNLLGENEQEAARKAFKDGRVAFDAGRFTEALERFEHAYSLSGRSELLFNIGIAADRIREDERALEAFEQYLEETPDSTHRKQVEQRVIALRQVLARDQREQPRDVAPTPAEVAAASTQAPERSPLGPSPSDRDDDSVLGEWWFWTGAAVLLIAGGATAYMLAQPPEEQAELPKPNTNVIVTALRLAP
jgi:tetratricopeptide (TPR) repeat protein